MESTSPWYNIEYISGDPLCGMKVYVLKQYVESCNRSIDFEKLNEEISNIGKLDDHLDLTISSHTDSKNLFWSISESTARYGLDFDENFRDYSDNLSEEKICYLSHNVRNPIQRFAILEGFLLWARDIEIAHIEI